MDTDVRQYTSRKIKEYRKLRGLTQKELGDKVGVKHNTISGYENGSSEPEQDLLFKIATALDVSINDLFPRTTPETPTTDLPALSAKDEREIAKDLEAMINNLDSDSAMAAYGGTVEDEEDRELLKASLLTSMRLAKQIAKKKYTPKKYRKEE